VTSTADPTPASLAPQRREPVEPLQVKGVTNNVLAWRQDPRLIPNHVRPSNGDAEVAR